jgi:hypothetical protein
MTKLVLLLEEQSARELLKGLLPRLLPDSVQVQYLVFEGKQHLEKELVRKLRGWRAPDSVFAVVRDQDAADCHVVKQRLVDLVAESGRNPVLVRVACRDLESWVVGDWPAVAKAFERPALGELANKAVYRNPDQLVRPVEEIRKFLPEYQKSDGARRVGVHLEPARSRSTSFRAFCAGVQKLVGGPVAGAP